MKRMPHSILRHAIMMVGRTLRSYALLSVTIILSFSLLLGYLVWTDSSLYNAYKETFSRDRNVVVVADQKLKSPAFVQMLREKAADYGNQSSLYFDNAIFGSLRSRDSRLQTEDGKELEPFQVCAVSVPAHAWSLYCVGEKEAQVRWLDGKEHPDYHLHSGEILIDERLYALFGLEAKGNLFSLSLSGYHDAEGKLVNEPFRGEFTVVGTISSGEPLTVREDGDGLRFEAEMLPSIAFSAADFGRAAYPHMNWYTPTMAFYSTAPEQVDALLRSLGITSNIFAVYAKQDQALERICSEIGLKQVITTALLIILGINLYSSLSNALNDRKFEIGVRRALGASKWSIIRQFLYESLLVMAANILASIWLVLTLALTYKVIYEHILDDTGTWRTFTLTVSPYSVGMFAVCSLTLTVVFSLIFAYQSTQVQIADYLKAE